MSPTVISKIGDRIASNKHTVINWTFIDFHMLFRTVPWKFINALYFVPLITSETEVWQYSGSRSQQMAIFASFDANAYDIKCLFVTELGIFDATSINHYSSPMTITGGDFWSGRQSMPDSKASKK